MNKRLVIFFFVATGVVLLLLGVVLSFVLFLSSPVENGSLPTSRLQYVEVNPSNSESSYGFANMKGIAKDSFRTYTNEETGNFIIINHFGDQEYSCTGTCSCTKDRRTSSVLTKGLHLFLSAVTGTIAFQIAKKTFHEECVSQYSDVCDSDSLVADVTKCAESDSPKEAEKPDERFKEFLESRKPQVSNDFDCTGHCVENFVKDQIAVMDFFRKEKGVSGCEEVVTSARIRAPKQGIHNAKLYFIQDTLIPFCRSFSFVWYKKDEVTDVRMVAACRGGKFPMDDSWAWATDVWHVECVPAGTKK